MDYASCLSATERRTTTAKRDDLHSKSLFLVKNKGQWNAKSGPKAAYGNFAMRTKFSGRLDSKIVQLFLQYICIIYFRDRWFNSSMFMLRVKDHKLGFCYIE